MASIDKEVKTNFPDDKQRFLVNIGHTSGWIKNYYVEFLKPFNISTQQLNILRILRRAKDWVAMSEVKERMFEKAPNATRLADKLIAKELIKRKRSETDRRIVYVHITENGLDLLKDFDEKHQNIPSKLLGNITDEEIRTVNEILDKLRG